MFKANVRIVCRNFSRYTVRNFSAVKICRQSPVFRIINAQNTVPFTVCKTVGNFRSIAYTYFLQNLLGRKINACDKIFHTAVIARNMRRCFGQNALRVGIRRNIVRVKAQNTARFRNARKTFAGFVGG